MCAKPLLFILKYSLMIQCIFFASGDNEFTEQEFQHKVCQHRNNQDHKIVDTTAFCQIPKVS